MSRSPDYRLLVAGLALMALGTVSALDQAGELDMQFDTAGPAVLGTSGLVAFAQSRGVIATAAGSVLLVAAALAGVAGAGSDVPAATAWALLLLAAAAVPIVSLLRSPAPVERAAPRERKPPRERSTADWRRTAAGVGLTLLAAAAFLQAAGIVSAAGDALLAVLVAALMLIAVLAPWWLRFGRSLASERAERIRSQERAEVAAHLHDSVLQTLALMQRHAEDPRTIASLARRQERDLRAWLAGRDPTAPAVTFANALERVAAEVEELHGATIEVVAVGDGPVRGPRAEALLGAVREAMVNAAKFAGAAGPIAVFAELRDGTATVFVRDRGPGFDPARVPEQRRGVRESIIGRMRRHGGRAAINATPGLGTEVELSMEDL